MVGISFLTLSTRAFNAAVSFFLAAGLSLTGSFLILAASRLRITLFSVFTWFIRLVRIVLYCFFAWLKCVFFARFVFFSVTAFNSASTFPARRPIPGAVLVTGTDTCWEGAIVVRPESPPLPLRSIMRSTTRVLGEALRFFGDGFWGEGGFLPGIDTPEGELLVRRRARGGIAIRPMARVNFGFSGLETSIAVGFDRPARARALRFFGAGTPSIGAVC